MNTKFWRTGLELLGSMRFAISVLVVIALASVIGTVVQQNQPTINYVNQFGPFWMALFNKLSIYSLYSSLWFFGLLIFLLTSTSLCVARNAPKFLREVRDMRDDLRENSLRSFGHKLELSSTQNRVDAVQASLNILQTRGFKIRTKEHPGATLIAAKNGSMNRLGYIAAHSAIVIMAVGYLLDTDWPLRLQIWANNKQALSGSALIEEVTPASRFGPDNLSFRSSALIPEGQESDVAIINTPQGAFIQDLPFTLKLERFHVEYYPTGMPRSFVSDVVLTDKETQAVLRRQIEVNKPLVYRNIAIYQSSFDDGGSTLELTGYPMRGAKFYDFPFDGQVGQTAQLSREGEARTYSIEFTGLRVINVEKIAAEGKADKKADLRNVGPSVQYKVRDAAGQAREYHNYMLPITLDNRPYFLSGVRENPDEAFRYLRIPADAASSVADFMRLRAALQNPTLRQRAAQQFAAKTVAVGQPNALLDPLSQSAERSLTVFAQGGVTEIARFVERSVPEPERQKTAEILVRLLQGSLWELWQQARQEAQLGELETNDDNVAWLQASMNALSDSFLYGAPVMLTLKGFDHVEASVFQLARAPGARTVYLGCLLLVIGIFSMFYVRERRVWFWVKDEGDDSSHARLLMAMSSNRRTLDFEQEFAQLCVEVQSALGATQKNLTQETS